MYKKIETIYHPGVHSVQVGDTTDKALELMRDKSNSCVVVLDGTKLVGIFTERDVVRYIATVGQTFSRMAIREIMTSNVITVRIDMYFFEAFNLLTESRIRHLVVVDDRDRPIGMLTQTDMVEHFGYDYFVKVKTVDQVMNRNLITVGADLPLLEAAKSMSESAVSCLVVLDECGNAAGILSERDMAKAVAEGIEVEARSVGEFMSSPVLTIMDTVPVYSAGRIMRDSAIRRLVVVDCKGRITGLLTQTDLVRGLESKYIEMLKQIIKEQGVELDKTVQLLAQKTLYLDCILSTSIHVGIVACDDDLGITYFNPAAEQIFGIDAGEVIGKKLATIHSLQGVSAERFEGVRREVDEHGMYSFTFTRENRRIAGGKRYINARMSGIDNGGELIGYVLMVEDVSDEIKAHETITRLAYYDVLTDLPNRALFNDRLAKELARSRRHGSSFALMLMDVDGFKGVNDTYGHNTGDALLQRIAGRLRREIRETDTAARLGGDEFCVILTELDNSGDALKVAEKLLRCLEPPVAVDGVELQVGYSMGIAMCPDHGEDARMLMTRADKAMYCSKRLGREQGGSHVQVFEEGA